MSDLNDLFSETIGAIGTELTDEMIRRMLDREDWSDEPIVLPLHPYTYERLKREGILPSFCVPSMTSEPLK